MGGEEKKLDPKTVKEFYGREDIQNIICQEAKDKEVGIKFEYGFGKRPDTILNPTDVKELAKQGATSFHFSEELWHDPLQISPELSQKEMDKIKKGWDLIIDIDTPHFYYSKLATKLSYEAIKHHGIKSITCKFSGNHGFHLAVPFEAFPSKVHQQETRLLFPDGPRRIAAYLKEMIRDFLTDSLLKQHSLKEIAKNCGREPSELMKNEVFDPFEVVDIDTILIASRHLCRMPYSFNEKSGWISVPIDPERIMSFDREEAKPENIKETMPFIDRSKAREEEGAKLIVQAFDFQPKIEKKEEKKEIHYEELQEAIPEKFFPPCIKKILEGLKDGRKRALFILINFLRSVGWSKEMVEDRVYKWNEANYEQLKEVYIKGQLRYAFSKEKRLPPNCSNEMYYKGLGLCFPDNICKKIKNPVNYARKYSGSNNPDKDKNSSKKG